MSWKVLFYDPYSGASVCLMLVSNYASGKHPAAVYVFAVKVWKTLTCSISPLTSLSEIMTFTTPAFHHHCNNIRLIIQQDDILLKHL